MKRIVLLGLTLIMGTVFGCSKGGIADGQPVNPNPDPKPKLSRTRVNQTAAPAEFPKN